jgi:uncharacterized membrane protein
MALEFASFATAESFFPTMTHAVCGIAFAFILIGCWSSMKYSLRIALGVVLLATLGCSQVGGDSQPLTTREKAAGVGTVVGSGVGAGIGSVWGYGLTGGGAGAALGLITGFLIGDHVQALEKKRSDLDQRIQESERELQRLCDEVEKLKHEADEKQ